jgi:tetratricopeptide (TPR) repeat protein
MRRSTLLIALSTGKILTMLRAFGPALSIYRRCIERYPNRRASVLSAIGFLYERRGNRQQAIEAYGEAAALEPTNAMHFFDLGCAFDAADKQEEALQNYRRAYESGEGFSYRFRDALRNRIVTLEGRQQVGMRSEEEM